jgi:hypothetical protein
MTSQIKREKLIYSWIWKCNWKPTCEVLYYQRLFINVFIYGLFNDALSSSDYVVPRDAMIREKWNIKNTQGTVEA